MSTNRRVDSIALIACNKGKGCVLEHDGPGIAAAIDDVGVAIDDLGLDDDAPDGLSIWEGQYVSYRCGEQNTDWDAELRGKFRDLTDVEWDRLRRNEPLWEKQPVMLIGTMRQCYR